MKPIFYVMALSAVFFMACSQNGPKKDIPLQHSDEVYTLVKAGKGAKPNPGDFSIFSIMIKGDDGRVLLDRSTEESYGKFKVPADTTGFRSGSPVDELLFTLVEGDSAVLVYELDSIEQMNPSVAGLNSISYEICIKEIISEEEQNKRNEEARQKMEENKEALGGKKEDVADRLNEVMDAYKNGTLGTSLKTTESGMEYVIENLGDGEIPKVGDIVKVHYYGILESNGEMFDNSYQRGEFFTFPVGQGRVIAGWDEALQIMPQGTEAIFFIPFELAYGAAGRPPQIPAAANLVFFIEYPM